MRPPVGRLFDLVAERCKACFVGDRLCVTTGRPAWVTTGRGWFLAGSDGFPTGSGCVIGSSDRVRARLVVLGACTLLVDAISQLTQTFLIGSATTLA